MGHVLLFYPSRGTLAVDILIEQFADEDQPFKYPQEHIDVSVGPAYCVIPLNNYLFLSF